ncbi:hypothetical protein [Deinococcus multiflagellatus]|uniref:ABC transporter permease n=1 Tax=Deinococcus multiflagellatus TaxID=1656887 RepID=A0ABW1ZL78_9DEIO
MTPLVAGSGTGQGVLALEGGPYRVGQVLRGAQRVQGVVSLRWLPAVLGDAAVVQVVELRTLRPQALPTLVVPARLGQTEWWTAQAAQAFGTAYAALPLPEYLGRATRYVDDARVRLQRLTVTWLLLLLLAGLLIHLAGVWFAQRERLRIERMLGRSQQAFWPLAAPEPERLGLGVLGAALLAGAQGALGQLPVPWAQAAPLWGLVLLTAVLGSVLLGLRLQRVPLGRARLRRSGVTLWAAPALLTGALVLGVPLLGTRALQLWQQQAAVVRDIGANTLVAITLPNAAQVPAPTRCPAQVPCLAVGWSDLYLWPPSFAQAQEAAFAGVGQFDPRDAAALGVRAVQGRLPRPGQREVVLSRAAFTALQQVGADFGVGRRLDAGFEVVGIVDLPSHESVTLFGGYRFYDMAVYVPVGAPGLDTLNRGQSVFLSPLGASALVMPRLSDAQRAQVQAHRAELDDLELYQPAAYAAQVAAGTRASVLWLLGALGVGWVLAGFSYHAALQLVLTQRAEEVSIWRLLGLPAAGVLRRLGTDLLRVVLGTGVATALLALALRRDQAALGAALALGTLAALLVGCGALLLAHRRRLAKIPIDRLFREVA